MSVKFASAVAMIALWVSRKHCIFSNGVRFSWGTVHNQPRNTDGEHVTMQPGREKTHAPVRSPHCPHRQLPQALHSIGVVTLEVWVDSNLRLRGNQVRNTPDNELMTGARSLRKNCLLLHDTTRTCDLSLYRLRARWSRWMANL